jgi:hypothetical protein
MICEASADPLRNRASGNKSDEGFWLRTDTLPYQHGTTWYHTFGQRDNVTALSQTMIEEGIERSDPSTYLQRRWRDVMVAQIGPAICTTPNYSTTHAALFIEYDPMDEDECLRSSFHVLFQNASFVEAVSGKQALQSQQFAHLSTLILKF